MSATRETAKFSPPPPPPPPAAPEFQHKDANDDDEVQQISKTVDLELDVIKNEIIQKCIAEARNLERLAIIPDSNDSGILIVTEIVQPILQIGPLCGLVALTIAGSRINPGKHVGDIFEEAKKRGYTKNGEMFSVENMIQLANDCFGYKSSIVDTRQDGIWNVILKSILSGNLILVPYDADFNHNPALRKGHAAHWGVLTGFALFLDKGELESFPDCIIGDQTIYTLLLNPLTLNEDQKVRVMQFLDTVDKKRIYVTARQGKSTHIGLWSLSELIASNQNLQEISPQILQRANDYVIYPIEQSLCYQLVILNID